MHYSALDIDRMRRACWQLYNLERAYLTHTTDDDALVERRLLTHMSNETTADELEEHARERTEARFGRENPHVHVAGPWN